MIDTVYFSVGNLDQESRPRGCRKAKCSVPSIPQSFRLIWVEFGVLLKLFGLMSRMLFFSSD